MTELDFDYKHFFDLSPDLLCIAGFDGYFKKVNPAVSGLLEYTEEELYSRPINDFIHEEDKKSTAHARNELTKSNPLYHFENRYVTRSGKTVWLAWTSFPVANEELVYAIAKDITHKKQLESERLSLLKNLTNANAELKQISLTTSHDLRSPVNSLLTIFELLDDSKIEDEDTLQLIRVLKLTGENLKESLNNYVDVLSEKLGEEPQTEEADLEDLLQQVVQSINSLITSTGTTIHTDFSEVKKINFNRAYLKSVYLNLITNAIKYARQNHAPVIHIRSKETIAYHQLIISDNGQGIDMKKAEGKLFGKHQTFHNHQDSKGIGLYLVYNHVTGMGGNIEVDSVVDEGTTFTISFPK